jgi:hypothetical protein
VFNVKESHVDVGVVYCINIAPVIVSTTCVLYMNEIMQVNLLDAFGASDE